MRRFFGDHYYWSTFGDPAHDVAELVRDLDYSRLGVVIDRGVPLNRFSAEAFGDVAFLDRIDGGEHTKTLSAVTRFIAAHQRELDRNSVVIAVGGGAVLDLVGLCCGLMYRGIRYVSVPTSLMAMADAAYGGKTAVNYASKNQIGMYHHPECVYVNAGFLQTLPDLHLRSGMIEIAKLAVFFDDIRAALLDARAGLATPADLALLAARRKLELLDSDSFEEGRASVLLYGHPFGNAFEAFASERRGRHIPHGLAVALGISFSAWLSEHLCEPRQRHIEQLELVAEWLDPSAYAADVTPSDGGALRELLIRDKYASGDDLRVPAICDRDGFETVALDVVVTAYEEWRPWLLAHDEKGSEARTTNMTGRASIAAFIAGRPSDETVAPLRFSSADGQFIITTDGRRLLDWSTCLNAPLGHSVRLDTAMLPVNAGNYCTEQRDALVERLAELFPQLAGFQFRSSGAEAVEASLRYLIATFGAALQLVTVEGCYHGLTLGARHLMGTADAGLARTELTFAALSNIERVSREFEARLREGPVAVWVEGVQGATLRSLPPGFVELVRRLRASAPHRLVLVCDDMLASIRCGDWCSVPLRPDVLIGGKSWAAGYPFSFFGVSAWIREVAGDILGTTSYGGNPVACAHALHTIERVGPLLARIRDVEAVHAPRFAESVATHPAVLRSEWHGLLFGYELRNDATALAVARKAAEGGLLVSQLGPVIRCSPPLDITDELLDMGLSRLLTAVVESVAAA